MQTQNRAKGRQEKMKQSDMLVWYVHGKGGSAADTAHYRTLFPHAEVVGFDYRAAYPWDAKAEFLEYAANRKAEYGRIVLVANSIGAYFCMQAGVGALIERAYFISPIVDMERLILDMLRWAGGTERRLEQEKRIRTDFGEELSWAYLEYVRAHPTAWNVPTEILYGSGDTLQSLETIRTFAERWHAGVTVMEGGEHWFHTEEQMRFLDAWMRECQASTL